MTAYTLAANATKIRPTVPARDTYGFGVERGIPMCVYTITHNETGRVYIGQSVGPVGRRWLNHMYKSGAKNSRIKRALLKYGREAFNFEVLDIAESQAQLDAKEQFWIKKLNTVTPSGFNLCSGGRGGNKLSAESIEKMRKTKLASRPDGYIPMGINAVQKRKTPEEKAASIAAGNASRRGKPTWLSANNMRPDIREKARLSKIGKPVPKKWKQVVRSDGAIFESINAAAAALSCDRRLISQALSGRRKTARGFGFSYKGN